MRLFFYQELPSAAGVSKRKFYDKQHRRSAVSTKAITQYSRDIADGTRVNDINDIYLYKYDGEADLSKATTDEVEQITWMTKDEIRELFVKGAVVSGIKDLSYFINDQDGLF